MRKFLFLLIFIFSVFTASNVLATGGWQSCSGTGPIGSAASVCQDLVKQAGESYVYSHMDVIDDSSASCFAKYKNADGTFGSGSPDMVGSACKIDGAVIPEEGESGTQSGNVASGSTGDSEEKVTKKVNLNNNPKTTNNIKTLTADEFAVLSFDSDKKKVTVGAIEEIRAAQAAQFEGLIKSGAIVRGERGADLNVGGTDVSIKAYRDDSMINNPRSVAKLVGSLNADSNLQLLLDSRALSDTQLKNITGMLTQKGIDSSRVIVPSPKSYHPIKVLGADGKVITY